MKELTFQQQGSCLLRISGIYKDVKFAERRLADYIMANPEKVLELTIEELADASDTSYATIGRFCKKLGYVGYKELRAELQNDVDDCTAVEDGGYEMKSGMPVETVCENVYNLALQALRDSFSILDTDMIEEITQKLICANRIFFFGAGNSGISAYYGYSKLFRIGLNCLTEKDSTLAVMYISQLKAGDVLFVISSSGRTSRVVEAAKYAQKNGVTVVSLGDFALSPLSKFADYNLFTTHRSSAVFMNIDMPLTAAQITMIDLLYMNCCVKMGAQASQRYDVTKGLADAEKLK